MPHSKQPNVDKNWECSCCKRWLPKESFNKNKKQTTGHDHKCRECNKQHVRKYNLRTKYGMDIADYEARYISQEGKCNICDKFCITLFVDHNHNTNEIRGLLCPRCNLALGNLLDSSDQAFKCFKYLEKWNC